MDLFPTKEGKVAFRLPSRPDTECFTSYKIFGDLTCGVPPLLALHGGPGSGHEYLITFANLWPRYGIPVIFYDQIGCGASTRLRQFLGDAEVWSEARFVAELENIIEHLGLHDLPSGFDILGHSWGGMLAAAYATQRPRGLRRLVIACSTASARAFSASMDSLIAHFPPEQRKAMEDAKHNDAYDSPECRAAGLVLLKRHFYRLEPFPPPELEMRMKHQAEDPTSFRSMYGPGPNKCTGTLSEWTCVERLPNINVPTLSYNAEFDTASDAVCAPFFELIPRVRWVTFPGGGHMCHLEGELREKVLVTVAGFLTGKYGE